MFGWYEKKWVLVIYFLAVVCALMIGQVHDWFSTPFFNKEFININNLLGVLSIIFLVLAYQKKLLL